MSSRPAPIRPFFFGSPEDRLYGVYRALTRRASAGIVLCPPSGAEYLRAHHVLVRLQGWLASRGFGVLRFDFHGCGNSGGASTDVGLQRWQNDVMEAAEACRELSGSRRLILVGLRLGASLAWLASTGGLSPEAAVLWSPIVRGATLVRELRRQHRDWLQGMWPRRSRRPAMRDEALGFPLPASLADELRRLDLTRAPRPRLPRVLLLSAGPRDPALSLLKHLPDCDLDVWHSPGAAPWTKEMPSGSAGLTTVQALKRIADWIEATANRSPAPNQTGSR